VEAPLGLLVRLSSSGQRRVTSVMRKGTGMNPPKRIQRHRSKGWRKPDGAIIVTRWTKWANPFMIGEAGIPDAKTAVNLYRRFLTIPGNPLIALLRELRGRTLICYCKPGHPCHADILLELANAA
jgi:Domain of unknown function (DUF4326)